MTTFKSVDTHGAGPPIQVPADELDAAEIERAKIDDSLIGPICELADYDFTGDTAFDALIGAAMTIRDREGFVVTDEDEL